MQWESNPGSGAYSAVVVVTASSRWAESAPSVRTIRYDATSLNSVIKKKKGRFDCPYYKTWGISLQVL